MDVGNWVRGLALVFQSSRMRAARTRRFNAAVKSHGVANVDVLEDRLLLTADFGDAPDTTAATGVNNYQTLAANGGPSHVIDTTQTTLYLGGGVDGEAGTQQSLAANLDNLFTTGGRNDEDGVMSSLDLTATVGASPKITLSATNTTGAAASLYGWIDYNHNGVFENATERAQIAVPTGTTTGRFTLQFPKIVGDIAGGTYARFRLSSDAAAANSNGAAIGGEVEDYQFQIKNRVKTPVTVSHSVRIANGVKGGPAIDAEDGYGYVGLVPIGDLDGNGVSDIVMGPSGLQEIATNRGGVYVLLRNADGSVSSSKRISSEVNGGPAIPEGEHFGAGGTSLGDIDGDGVTDIAISSIDGEENAFVYILNLKPDGSVKSHRKLSSGVDGFPQLDTGDGAAVLASLGDIDGDGISDIAVGAPGADGTGTDRGAIHILRMNADGTVKGSTMIDASGEWNPASADGDDFGEDITVLGDIDGNGVTDLGVMSEILHSDDSTTTVINILQLNVDGTVKQATRLVSAAGGDPSISNVDILTGLTAIGDIDGDGINDLAVSGQEFPERDPENLLANLFDSTNVINLLSLNSNGSVKRSITIPGPDTVGNNLFTNFTVLAKLDDANGDLNLAVGIPFYDVPFTENELENAKSSLTVLTLTPKIENTAAPTVPVLNAISTTPGQNPAISWAADRHADSYEIWLRNQTTGQVVLNSVSTTSNSFTPPAGVGNFVVWVRAVNEIGKSSWSRSSTFVSKSPVTVIATPDGMSRRPELKWNSLAGAAKYEIWLSDTRTPSVATIQTTTRTNSTSFTPPTNLQAGTYRLWVRGMTADGVKGQWSTVDEFSVVPSTTMTRISEPLINRPRFDFTAIPGVAKYDIWISSRRSQSTAALHTMTLNASPFYQTTSVLAPGDYVVWVRGVNSDGSFGEWSARSSFTTGAPPQFEALPSSELPLDSSVTLKWTPVVGAYRYEVSVELNGEYTLFKNPTTVQITVYGRIQFPQSVTRFRVRAIGSGGAAGSWSSPTEITFQDKVTSVKGVFSAEDTGHPKFTWQRPLGAYTYEVRILDVLNASAEVVHVSDIAASEFIPADSLPSGKYEFQVRPVTAAGAVGVWSNPVVYSSVQIIQLKPVVVGVDPKATLEWEPVDGAVNYEFDLRNVSSPNGWMSRHGITTTNALTGPIPDGTYELFVRANGHNTTWNFTTTFEVARTPVLNLPHSFPVSQTSKQIAWSPILGVDHYDVWIETASGSLALRNENVTTNSLDIGELLSAGDFKVWVRGIGVSNSIGPWSLPVNFSITDL